MGVLYIVAPLSGEVVDWLEESGIGVPAGGKSRFPTLLEIRETLDSLEGFDIEYNDNGVGSCWQAMISSAQDPGSGPWTLLNINRRAEPSEPQDLSFEKGYPELIVDILARLSTRCGVLVLIPDTGEDPLLISAGDDPAELCRHWEHTAPADKG